MSDHDLQTDDQEVIEEYHALYMLKWRLQGQSFAQIAEHQGISLEETEERINTVASDCMRGAMAATRGDPTHPQKGLFQLEDFTLDPRRCMQQIMQNRIDAIEARIKAGKAS